MPKVNVIVVGNGMVGHHYVEQLTASAVDAHITVIGGETRPAYDRVHLSEYFAGRAPEDLALTTREHYREIGVDAHFGDMVTRIDRDNKKVITENGQEYCYDKLVLATGSYPFVPPVKGNDLPPCVVYRTIDDLGMIQAQANNGKIGVVVGGGLLGLEAANAVQNLGLETHVVEFAPGLMGVQLDAGGSGMLRRKIEALGVKVHTSKATQVIEENSDGEGRVVMRFADGGSLATDMIVFSAGIRPYDQLARDCGLTVGDRGGIEIDYHCKTSDSDIFAIGECALFGGRIYGLVAPGYRMAEAAISQLGSDKVSFQGADMSTKLKLLGVDVGSIGDAHGKAEGSIAYTFSDERIDVYKRLIVSADGKKLLGAVLVGDCSEYDTLLQYFLNGIYLPADPETLILPTNVGGAPALGAAALPMTATICSCHNVSKGDIVNAMDAGSCSLGEVKSATAASSGCGGCAALLKNIVDDEMAARGLEVNKAICEHFNYTRQEMFHIIKVETIKSFDELLDKHGTGRGCDICKPTAGSILASLWNDYVLDDKHVGLQDTNDTFLANMQKNGTYSVVPRIAGGEITPDKLIVLGQVAKKYKLYTKITGGQRIDLFGARVQHLPAIWQELIEAGFETGHAYGKALRTVKSCVGSTWCRYGVQDSVAMALYVENRYKGLRSPHKLKSGVSGCTRECAEAQSKDFGIIATENGWNLYVGGNGGMKPRHAELFATDLDDETLIKYIDRFLIFYVRTADRLQRTSVWMGNLEGGLDYLKQVVIEDSLGICDDLEAQMNAVVGSYQCEWKTTIENPEKLKRFRQFVNSEAEDRDIIFVEERGQPRPATEEERQQILATPA
ncbi:MAG: nitrite reductase large subunit NirB [Pseudomonadales bacterium]|jgi:nitrite reductase (NADH) large subunit|nr:nitrite reductase large subunit NirB [Porticoccaceae bacterium]|tara:strand:+ start:4176 stop:6707 length:2532 start_codon:yes stop_codon:yes gene_type:complete